jgi:hypothetical protein
MRGGEVIGPIVQNPLGAGVLPKHTAPVSAGVLGGMLVVRPGLLARASLQFLCFIGSLLEPLDTVLPEKGIARALVSTVQQAKKAYNAKHGLPDEVEDTSFFDEFDEDYDYTEVIAEAEAEIEKAEDETMEEQETSDVEGAEAEAEVEMASEETLEVQDTSDIERAEAEVEVEEANDETLEVQDTSESEEENDKSVDSHEEVEDNHVEVASPFDEAENDEDVDLYE